MPISPIISRRDFLAASATALGLANGRGVSAQPSRAEPDENYKDFESGDIPDLTQLGTNPSLREEIDMADRLLSIAPIGKMPIDVLRYLEGIRERNKDNEAYNGGWKSRWNPVIVRFFEQTKTRPSGDTTPWCAASLNWCLAISGLKGTSSASSGSFRDAPGWTDEPHVGDIVVFRRTDWEEARAGRGHVGLFLAEMGDQIQILGGNQKSDYGHHAVCRKWFQKAGKQLTLHSYHSVDSFRVR